MSSSLYLEQYLDSLLGVDYQVGHILRTMSLTPITTNIGPELTAAELAGGRNLMAEARNAELGEEILRLSTTYGVLTEYTAFLALEGSDLGDWSNLVADAKGNIDNDPIRVLTPGIMIVFIVLCVNFIGDGLRDAFDPRQNRVRQ